MLNDGHRRYLTVDQGIGPAIFNLVLNGAIAWAMFRSAQAVPLWGEQSIGVDTIFTTFLLPFFTCLIVTGIVRKHVQGGRVSGLSRLPLAALGRMPGGRFARSVAFGGVALVTAAPVTMVALAGLGIDAMTPWSFIVFKGVYAAALAAVVTPLIALVALSDQAATAGVEHA